MHDLRDALHSLRGAPVLSAVAVLSLALGIAANTAIFSIFNSLLLKPLPVRDPDRLVVLEAPGSRSDAAVSYDVWTALREPRVFDQAFAWATDRVNVSSTAETRFAQAIWVTGNFFDVLGVPATLGRTLLAHDDRRGGGPDGLVAVISDDFWRRQFGGAQDVLGRALHVDGVPFTIVGVTPRGFLGVNVGHAFEVALPLETEPQLGRVPPRVGNPYWPWLRIMARLGPGERAQRLEDAVRRLQPFIRDVTMPAFDHAEDRDAYLREPWTLAAGAGGVSRLRRQYRRALLTLLGGIAVVLMIACANIAALMLARTAARGHEFSVRRALGASPARLMRLVLMECLLMSTAGAALGLALGYWSSGILARQLSTWASTIVLDLSLDWRVLLVTTIATVGTTILFGIAPALRAARSPAGAVLQRLRGTAAGARFGPTEAFVVIQVALSLALVVAAGLFARSFVALAYRDLGFDRDRLLVAIVNVKPAEISADARAAMFERLRDAALGVPGVEAAAVSLATPLGSAGVRVTPSVAVPTESGITTPIRVLANPVSPGWFGTYRTRLLAGRDFDTHDRLGRPQVAIVNAAFAGRYLGAGNPVGRAVVEQRSEGERRIWHIVGVVENAAFTSVRDAIEPTMYRPLAQVADEELLRNSPAISVTVRSSHDSPAVLSTALASALAAADAGLSVSFLTVREQLDVFYIRERLLARLAVFFGAFALLLAALGVYGVMTQAVNRRRAEIGVRLALGATPAAVLRMIAGRTAVLLAGGLVAGMAASWWISRYVATLLYAIPPFDTIAFGVAVTLLTTTVAIAAWTPARRAARVDPAAALRES